MARLDELKQHLPDHWKELALDQDKVALDPSYEEYDILEKSDKLLFVTVREDGRMMGYFVGLAKFRQRPRPYLALGVITATLFHGLYDFFLSINSVELIIAGTLVSLIVSVTLSFRAMKILNEHSPFKYSTIIARKHPPESL